MEFEELKKVWDSQNNQQLYAFDEHSMEKIVDSKKKKAIQIANISEFFLILVNTIAGIIYIFVIASVNKTNTFMYVTAAWLFGCTLYLLINRWRRIRANKNYEHSVKGNLQLAISLATYQVHLSQAMRWNILPIALLTLLMVWDAKKPVIVLILLAAAFTIAYFISGWEHNIHRERKEKLKSLQRKLESEI
jgi:hypothetical protein